MPWTSQLSNHHDSITGSTISLSWLHNNEKAQCVSQCHQTMTNLYKSPIAMNNTFSAPKVYMVKMVVEAWVTRLQDSVLSKKLHICLDLFAVSYFKVQSSLLLLLTWRISWLFDLQRVNQLTIITVNKQLQ